MRMTTKYWFGVKHVGNAAKETDVRFLPVKEGIQFYIKELAENELHRRIEFAIARTEEEVRNRLDGKSNTGVGSRSGAATESIMAEFDSLLAELGVEED